MHHALYTPSADDRASVQSARDLRELRQAVAALHLRFSWTHKVEQLLALECWFRSAAEPHDCPPYWCPVAGFGPGDARKILVEPIPLWPAEHAVRSQEYVARRLRQHGRAQRRCIVYSGSGGVHPAQSFSHRVAGVLGTLRSRATGSLEGLPPHVLANKALRLFRLWEKRAAEDPAALWAARSMYAHFLDAPPVDTWHGYYAIMGRSVEYLRSFIHKLVTQACPVVLLVPFAWEPYVVTLLTVPDYPTNLLLANVFVGSPLKLNLFHADRHADRAVPASGGYAVPAAAGGIA